MFGKSRGKRGLAALAVLLLLTGCAAFEKQEIPKPDLSKLKPETRKQQGTMEAEPPIPSEEESVPEAPVFRVEETAESRMEGEQVLVDGYCSTPVIAGSGYEAAAKAIAAWAGERRQQYREDMDEYEDRARERLKASGGAENDSGVFSASVETECTRADSRVISYVAMERDFEGSPRGRHAYYGYTFDAQSGERLELADILADRDQFCKKSWDYFLENVDPEIREQILAGDAETIESVWDPGENWYLTASGITVANE